MTAVLRGHLSRRLDRCSPDELRVLDVVLSRLERRRDKVGSLDLARRSDIFAELNEGLIDAVIACTILAIRTEDAAHARAREELTELAHWQRNDQRTVVSGESHRLALDDLAEHGETYEKWDLSEFGGKGSTE